MEAKALIGLWEFTGFWVDARNGPVMPPSGTSSSTLREFLFFDADDTFFFAKFPRDETIYFDPETRRFVCSEFRSELLKGNWQLKGNQLIESVSQADDTSPRQQAFELEELSANRLIVKERAGDGTKFLKVVYALGDVESFPAPPLADSVAEEVADDISDESSPVRLEEEVAQVQAEQQQVEALLTIGKQNSAHRLAQLSVRHSERIFGTNHPNTAACLCTLGACLVKLGESKAAITEMERAKLIYETHFGPHDLMTASVLNNLAPAYRDQNDFRAAIAAASDAVRIRWAELGAHSSTATSVQNLAQALSGLGLLTEALRCYYTAEPMFRDALGPAHPRTRGILQNIERLSEAVNRDPRFACDALPQVGVSDIGMAAVQKTLDICDGLLQAEPASDLFTLAYGRAAHKESYDHLIFAIRTQERLIATHPEDEVTRLEHLRIAQSCVRASVHAPVGKFSCFLKRVDRSKLGPKSQATLEHVFPNFAGTIERAQQRDAALKKFGIDPHATPTFNDQKRKQAEPLGYEFQMVGRQFRRYSGENNLPSQRYSSVCIDASGDDRQTLCRELFEYSDLRIPGLVFVSDTSDAALMKALSGMGMPQPRVAGIFVFLLPPSENDEQLVFRHFIGPVLTTLYGPYESAPDQWDSLSIVFIPTELLPVEIDDVIDLRQPATQDWLFRFFKNGDGAIWLKTADTQITGFAGMLPSLVYPEYGGSGVTKSLGSWMRSAGIQGLVFPSARSNVAIEVDQCGALRSFHGWNFVDYRGTELVPDQLLHEDNNDWYGFVAGRQSAPVLRQDGKSWAVEGNEQRYEQTREFMLKLLAVSHF